MPLLAQFGQLPGCRVDVECVSDDQTLRCVFSRHTAISHHLYLHQFTYKLKIPGKSNHENRHLFRSQEFVEGGA